MPAIKILEALPVNYLRVPTITGWNRLESRPRKQEFNRSLQAEIRDPLWMLTRQWQMGEFQGEDAATPVFAHLLTNNTVLDRYAPAHGVAIPQPGDLPLETLIEKEKLPEDLKLQVQAGRHFFKLLELQRGNLSSNDYPTIYRGNYPLQLPSNAKTLQGLQSHAASSQWFDAALNKLPDGISIIKDIVSGKYNNNINNHAAIPLAEKTILLKIGQQLDAWYKRLYFQPDGIADNAWNSQHIEYQLSCASPVIDQHQDVLVAEQYYTGHLDWYSFDHHNNPSFRVTDKPGAIFKNQPMEQRFISFIPSYIKFSGMPLPRYWEMEDSQIDFGDINANTTDLAKLMITEFGLVYTTDWCLIPYNLSVGSICEVKGLVVTDTFGQKILIRAAGRGPDDNWQHWNMYGLSRMGFNADDPADNRLFLCPSTGKILESEPLEKVNFIRDEMANIVWGVENTIPAYNGDTLKGFEASLALRNYLESLNPTPAVTPIATDAKIQYVLGTTVPDNWTPFIPVHVDGSNREIQLQQAAMPDSTGYRGVLLDNPHPYFIYEEEIPRTGAIVSRSFQRTRWYNGKTYVWIGRRKETGKGEGSSGLQFDRAVYI